MMMLAILLAGTIEYRPPAPRLNPEICVSAQRTGRGYIVMKETWVLPRLKLKEGQRIMPEGREGMMIAGHPMTDLIEKTCSAPGSRGFPQL